MSNPQPTLDELLQTATQHHRSGRLQQAEALYREILRQNPACADALHLLGVLASQVGRHEIAVDLIRRSIALKPQLPEAHNNLGNALTIMGRYEEAIAACSAAIALRPDYAEAHFNLGNALYDRRQVDEAIAAFRNAIALKGDYPEAHSNLGVALFDRRQVDAAIAAYRNAIALKPDYCDAHAHLGTALMDKGCLDESIAAYRRAIALRPDNPQTHNNLGNAMKDKGRLDDAVAAYRQAIALKPDIPEVHNNLGAVLKDMGRFDEAIAAFRQAIALNPGLTVAHNNLVYTLHFHPDYDAQQIATELKCWSRLHAEPLRKSIQAHSNDRNPERRLKIGYVSPDFREHPVGRFLLPLLAHHDKRHIEIFAYSAHANSDSMTERLRSYADVWRNISVLSDTRAAEQIRRDQIDILVDLTMHMANTRLPVFAHKPAPVQVTYLAYCSSTGMQTMDYRLSDPYLNPPGADESLYSERTMRLPETYWCYEPPAAAANVGPLPALSLSNGPAPAPGFITFGCLNNFCKISDPVLTAWANLLHAVENSQLLLHAHEGDHRRRVMERLEQKGIHPSRVRFAGQIPLLDYLKLYSEIDIALDTFPYGGGTTTCDALWMGVPVVSLLGNSAVGRGGFSILSNLGAPEWVARSQEQYVQIARDLANDLPGLSRLRSTLRGRMEQSPLMDAPRFARNIEAAFRQMWRQWCSEINTSG